VRQTIAARGARQTCAYTVDNSAKTVDGERVSVDEHDTPETTRRTAEKRSCAPSIAARTNAPVTDNGDQSHPWVVREEA
jgi:hypothetical protein